MTQAQKAAAVMVCFEPRRCQCEDAFCPNGCDNNWHFTSVPPSLIGIYKLCEPCFFAHHMTKLSERIPNE